MIELTITKNKDSWDFYVMDGNKEIAYLEAEKHNDTAVFHNRINEFSHGYLKIYREIFIDIRAYLRLHGIKLVMAVCDKPNKKVLKYWKIMGFECFGETLGIAFAVMEA